MVQRLNEKDTRIKEIKEAHQKERETHLALLKAAQDLVDSQRAQITLLEAPKRPIRVLDVDS